MLRPIMVRIPEDLYQKLKKIADKENRSVSNYIKVNLINNLIKKKKELK